MVYAESENIDAIISEIRGIAEKLACEGIDPDELERVRKPAVNRIQDMVRRNEYWLNSVLSDSRRYPQQIDWSRSPDGYLQVCPAGRTESTGPNLLEGAEGGCFCCRAGNALG